MTTNKTTPKELWARQQISGPDVDYDLWNKKRISVQAFSQMSQSCIFTVDVFKERYDFASDSFAHLFGYNPTWIKTIRQQGDLLEERIHPDDRMQLTECQIEHGQFIYSLPQLEESSIAAGNVISIPIITCRLPANISIPYVECTATVYQCKQPATSHRNRPEW